MSVAAWQRASLTMLVLEVPAVAPRHGYGISQALVSAGLQPIKGAQLYPALARLEDEGAIAARWEQSESGPARKVYDLTSAGRAQREELHAQWHAFITAAAAVAAPTDLSPARPVASDHDDTLDCDEPGCHRDSPRVDNNVGARRA